ncbi:MAG TPA: hypothetical protein VKN35_00775, partial [Xanthomonadales bacterium]|nr:hypothetical protein [Xanthomonadales bacterium]
MKALNTQSLVRSVSKLAMFATFTASALISGQAFAGKPSPPPANFVQIEVPVTYNFGYPAHIDPRTGDTCMYNPNNSVFCMGFPVAFAMTASN